MQEPSTDFKAPFFGETSYKRQTSYPYVGKTSSSLPEHPWTLSKNNDEYLSQTAKIHFRHHEPEPFLSSEETAKLPTRDGTFHRAITPVQFSGTSSHSSDYVTHNMDGVDRRSFAPNQRADSSYPFSNYTHESHLLDRKMDSNQFSSSHVLKKPCPAKLYENQKFHVQTEHGYNFA